MVNFARDLYLILQCSRMFLDRWRPFCFKTNYFHVFSTVNQKARALSHYHAHFPKALYSVYNIYIMSRLYTKRSQLPLTKSMPTPIVRYILMENLPGTSLHPISCNLELKRYSCRIRFTNDNPLRFIVR